MANPHYRGGMTISPLLMMADTLLAQGSALGAAKVLALAAESLAAARLEEATALARRLIAIPEPLQQGLGEPLVALLGDLAGALMAENQPLLAEPFLARALALAPIRAELWNSQGALSMRLGRPEAARQALLQALARKPDHAPALANLGNLHHLEGRFKEAVAAFKAALAQRPDDIPTTIDLAEALNDHGFPDQGLTLLAGLPRQSDTLVAKGNLFKACGRCDEAAGAYDEALAQSFDPALAVKRAILMPVIPNSAEQIATERARLGTDLDRLAAMDGAIADPERHVGATTFHLAYHGQSNRALQEKLARFHRAACPDLSFTAPHCLGRPRPGKRIRIGFVSRHLRAHTMGKLNQPLIAGLDRTRFETVVFQLGAMDGVAQAIAHSADRAVHLAGPLASLRDTIAQAELDLLYYPDIGMEPTTYFLAFARLAPVQLVACGHPDTTGIDTLDGFISGANLDAPDGQELYTEPLFRLPGFPLYMRRPPTREPLASRAEIGLPDAAHLYVCAQSLFKFHPDFDAVLAAILDGDAQGKLVVIEQQHPEITRRFKSRLARRIANLEARLIVLMRLEARLYQGLLRQADCVLDPLHFGGGSSSLEAFALGVPIVTLPSRFLRERVTYAAYRKMGIDDLIARDRAHYVDLALRLANDPAWRADLSKRLLEAAPVLFEDPAELKTIEDFLDERARPS
ncbi:MAG: tetratricopeptide repeat protein [Rhodospirillales bacterium]|nr:tetratricopeptide repeat protein [Rhodospirillales bacterium]